MGFMSRACDNLLTSPAPSPVKEWRKRHKMHRFRDKKGFLWSRWAPEVEISHQRPPEPQIQIETETRLPPPHVIDSFDDDESTLDVEEDTLEAGQNYSSPSLSSLEAMEDILVTNSEGVETLNEGGLDFLAASEPTADSDIPRSDKGLENISASKTNVRKNGDVRQAQARERETDAH